MAELLHELTLTTDSDLPRAQQDARRVAESLGFNRFEQTRIATAVSEIVRNALIYARSGVVRMSTDDSAIPSLVIEVADTGGGIEALDDVLAGTYASKTGLGVGILGAKQLMDDFDIESAPTGTRVRMSKRLPRKARPLLRHARREVSKAVGRTSQQDRGRAHYESHTRRLEQALIEREHAIAQLRQELEDTNRGVMALYAELDERATYERHAKELKMRLMSEMGHELRTPLHSLVSISGFLLDRLDGPLTSEQELQVRLLRDTAVNLTAYIDDLLDFAKAEAGKTAVRKTTFSVRQVFAALRHIMEPIVRKSPVSLHIDDPHVGITMEADEGKLSQILRNFVSNAIKYTEEGQVRVWARLQEDSDTVVFNVSDTGIGIAPEDQERIFEEFAQVQSPMQPRFAGSGLGLPLTRRLSHLLGGRVELESTPGKGSTFRAIVPRVYQGEEAAAAAVPSSTPRRAPLHWNVPRRRVLVVDDDPASRYVLRRLLQDHHDVMEAIRGREGLEAALERRPHVLFLDLVMPDLSGFEVLDSLQADPRTANIPVVIYTSLAVTDNDRARLRGAQAVVRKATASREDDVANLERALVAVGLASEVRG